jgi:hypothetical protein
VGEVGSRCRGARMLSTTSVLTKYSAARLLFNFFSIAHSAYSFDFVFDGIWVESFSGCLMYPFHGGFFFDICLLL